MSSKEAKAELVAFYRRAEREATVTVGGSLVFHLDHKREIVRLMSKADMNGGSLANILIDAGDYGRVSASMRPIIYNRIAVRVNTFRVQIEKEKAEGVNATVASHSQLSLKGFQAPVQQVVATRRPDELSVKLSRMREERADLDSKIEKMHEKLLQLDENIDTLEAAQKILG